MLTPVFTPQTPQYVLIIDEINRGNISKIFGELITLIEPGKRLGMPDQLRLKLPSSPEKTFAVPPNLHIIGTLNTADRSIALMDVALRRRFVFEEMMPDVEVLRKNMPESPAKAVTLQIFTAINARITFLYDRDHQIGHAFFLSVASYQNLRDVIACKVIPLLQEYFYGSWDKIAMVLGCACKEDGTPRYENKAPILVCKKLDEKNILGFDHEDYESSLSWSIADVFCPGLPAYKEADDTAIKPYLEGIARHFKAS